MNKYLLVACTSKDDTLAVSHPTFYENFLSLLVLDSFLAFAFSTSEERHFWVSAASDNSSYLSFSRSFSPSPSQSGQVARDVPNRVDEICQRIRMCEFSISENITHRRLDMSPSLSFAFDAFFRFSASFCARSAMQDHIHGLARWKMTCLSTNPLQVPHIISFSIIIFTLFPL